MNRIISVFPFITKEKYLSVSDKLCQKRTEIFLLIALSVCPSYLCFAQKLIPDVVRKTVIERSRAGLYSDIIIGVTSFDGQCEYLIFNENSGTGLNETTPLNFSSLLPFFLSFQLNEALHQGQLNPNSSLNDWLPKEIRFKDKNDRKAIVADLLLYNVHPYNYSEPPFEEAYKLPEYSKEKLLTILKGSRLTTKPGIFFEQNTFSLEFISVLLNETNGIKADIYLQNLFENNKLKNSFIARNQIREYLELPGLLHKIELNDYFYGAAYSSVEDILKLIWGNILHNPAYLKHLSNDKLFFQTASSKTLFGFALNSFQEGNNIIYYQKVKYGKSNFFICFDSLQSKAVLIYSKGAIPIDDIGFYILDKKTELRHSKHLSSEETTLRISGEYYSEGENSLSIIRRGNEYYLYWGNTGGLLLEHLGYNNFTSIFADLIFEFSTNENEEVTLTIRYNDNKLKRYYKL